MKQLLAAAAVAGCCCFWLMAAGGCWLLLSAGCFCCLLLAAAAAGILISKRPFSQMKLRVWYLIQTDRQQWQMDNWRYRTGFGQPKTSQVQQCSTQVELELGLDLKLELELELELVLQLQLPWVSWVSSIIHDSQYTQIFVFHHPLFITMARQYVC